MSVGPALMYGGPEDGAVWVAPEGATEMPEYVWYQVGSDERYVRLDCMPFWMTFLPSRSMETTIYVWEDCYVV